jgi:hypothetical protein
MSWDSDAHQREVFRAVEEVCGELDAIMAKFHAASSDAEKWPLALRALRLGPRLRALKKMLDRVN